MSTLLEVDNLTVQFKTESGLLTAVDDVSFDIRRGEILGLVGESGCGKSVTSMSLLRLIPQPPGIFANGKVVYKDHDLLQLPIKELRRIRGREISVIFQEPMTALSPLMRVGNQLVEAIRLHEPDTSRKEAWARARDWLQKVGIPDSQERMYAYPYQFSGGMRQRAMIAMALIHNPRLIIADEPTTALDVTIQAQIFDLMKEMTRGETSVLLITHDMGVIWEMCDRVLVMYASQVVEEATVDELFSEPLHPYTEGLMKAVPTLAAQQDRLETIPGQVPSPLDYPDSCHFCERCPYAFDRCRQEMPQLKTFGARRRARCFKVEQEFADV